MNQEIPKFGEMTYWDDGYKTGDAPKEWFVPYSTISAFINKHILMTSNCLVIGCGTSSLSSEMFDSGYKFLESMDYSPSAIEEMKITYPNLKWSIEDVRKMTYLDEQFDAVVDKGTLDCLFFLDDTNESLIKMLQEVSRILKPNGKYCVVTCGHPMQRVDLLCNNKSFNWKLVDWEEYDPPEGNWTHPSAYLYCIQKNLN